MQSTQQAGSKASLRVSEEGFLNSTRRRRNGVARPIVEDPDIQYHKKERHVKELSSEIDKCILH